MMRAERLTISTIALVLPALAAGCAGVRRPATPGPVVISCSITRTECATEGVGASGPNCAGFVNDNKLTATTCYDSTKDGAMTDKCKADFCSASQSRNGFNGICNVTAASEANLVPGPNQPQGTGSCVGESNENHFALVTFTTRFRQCSIDPSNNIACEQLLVGPDNPNPVTMCVDARTPILGDPLQIDPYPAASDGPPFDQYGTLNILSIQLDDATDCPALGAQVGALVYGITPGTVATASGAGVTAPIAATGGLAVVNQNCSDDVFGCVPTAVDRLEVDVPTMTVAGAQLTEVVVRNTAPAPVTMTLNSNSPPTFSLAGGALSLQIDGNLNGVPSSIILGNDGSLPLTATSAGFSLSGTFSVHNEDGTGHPLSVSVATSLSGTPASGQTLACADETGLQRLFGFEDALSWTSTTSTLSPVTSPVTQGCGALGINGQGYMTITGAPFSTSGLALAPALSVDLFVPGNQPSQFWLGALQSYLTCPSANVFNAYIGQVELTGRPQNAYSTLRFPLPATVTGTLQQSLPDCSFSFALNVNQTGQTWILDNLRFTQ
jgi:hypothetical protein